MSTSEKTAVASFGMINQIEIVETKKKLDADRTANSKFSTDLHQHKKSVDLKQANLRQILVNLHCKSLEMSFSLHRK